MIRSIDDRDLYDRGHVVVKHIYDEDHAAIVWFGFTQGQMLKDHVTTSIAIIQVLRGRIHLNAANQQILTRGQMVKLPPNEHHAITALEESLVPLVLIPHPRYHSLANV
ncbi:hypothetical protein BXT84_12765 [Sulfobacillus thermotolerans]|uniref:Cupin n=1 Tax=Sulfobacillus thermotolerans TaxID=338644 RepID=A0ABN5H2Q0_9FIRM|nr:hypothetical protein BXT84_12765 [Sulfobacillus thermotolerans]